jgi:hypothetical protein
MPAAAGVDAVLAQEEPEVLAVEAGLAGGGGEVAGGGVEEGVQVGALEALDDLALVLDEGPAEIDRGGGVGPGRGRGRPR